MCITGHVIPSAGSGAETNTDKSSESPTPELMKSVLVMSGGEGYIDFRMGESHHTSLCPYLHNVVEHSDISLILSSLYVGDEGGDTENLDEPTLNLQPFLAKAERSHLIVWQIMANEE